MSLAIRNLPTCLAAFAVAVIGAPLARGQSHGLQVQGAPINVNAVKGESLTPITSVSPAPNDGILVIGGATRQQLFLVGSDGKARADVGSLATIGSRLGSPVAAAFVNPTTVMVLDGQSAAWATVRLRNGQWFLASTGKMPLSRISGMCTTGDDGSLYVMGKREAMPGIIHKVKLPGQVRSSFGMRFTAAENPAVEYGHISCAANPNTISVASRLYPEIRTYAADGRVMWATRLKDFKAVGFERSGRLVRFVYPADSIWDEIVAILNPGAGVLAVQIARHYGLPGYAKTLVLRTVLLSRANGTIRSSQTNLPMIYGATPRYLYARKETGEGGVQIYRFRNAP